ncbi:PilZ domain-containing protein [Erwinia piriflorinigrans]|uniref:Flagellar brake protein YcgR n=1 Tax=Erwinia piriflorinigrans CFBP 5888 TaxID=1161919 RepID=V5ZBS9_9GAMM|nr:PilZ domain-containing protein [Erwinia piriflorinigrans]CCG88397.1 hypothetical protein EPIR_3034 [Erwinia piriflorinigrans CFBP 5888]
MLIPEYKELKRTDRYEILALLRESMKQSGSVEFMLPERAFSCQFLSIDLQRFTVANLDELSMLTTPVEVVIKGNRERISFTTSQSVDKSSFGTLSFDFPQEVVITQRRSHHRIAIPEHYNFFCEGRFRDGFIYKLRIKDLSLKGIGLHYPHPLPGLTRPGILLTGMVIMLGEKEQDKYMINIILSGIKEVTALDSENRKYSYHIISCRFQRPSKAFNRKIEEIIMHILLEQKKLKRLR